MLSLGGQSLEDKLYAFKYFISGQGLSLVVHKATTSELLGPKRKHLNYLVGMTNEPNVSIPQLAKYLMQRTRHPEWTVAFKALITIHHLMSYGNEKFIQNLASSTVNHRTFDYLSSFADRTTTRSCNMSTFLRRYSRYVNIKINAYRSLGIDFCKVKTGNLGQSPMNVKNMTLDQLVTTLPIIQNQFDKLVEFDASPKDLNNGIINSAFSSLYKDFVKLYITYQTAIIRLLDLYLTVSQLKRAQELLEVYKKFLIRMEIVSDFMRVIDAVGMDKSDMPNISSSPVVPLKTLERHIEQLELASKSKTNAAQTTKPVEVPTINYVTFSMTRRRALDATRKQLSQLDKANEDESEALLKVGRLATKDKANETRNGTVSLKKANSVNNGDMEELSNQTINDSSIGSASKVSANNLSDLILSVLNGQSNGDANNHESANVDEKQDNDLIIFETHSTEPPNSAGQAICSPTQQQQQRQRPYNWVQVEL